MNLKKNINFYPIDLVLDNLGSYYKIIQQQYELYSGGGNHQESTTDSSIPKNGDKKYYKKYKNLIKSSAQSISYYKNLIQLQMSNQMKINNYYQNLVGVLKSQRDRLATGYQVLGNDFKNEKEKISMLETMITGLEKYVQSSKDLDINVKKITLRGGAMGYDQFQDYIMQDMTALSQHIEGIDNDKNFLEGKITELHKRMGDIVAQNEDLFKIKAEVEWIVNQMENVDDGVDKAGQQEFDDLYGKIKSMIDSAKSKGTISASISEYVHKLEEYASYLENFIKTNNKTLGAIKLEKMAPRKQAVDEKKEIEDNLGTVVSTLTKKVEPVVEVEDPNKTIAVAKRADAETKKAIAKTKRDEATTAKATAETKNKAATTLKNTASKTKNTPSAPQAKETAENTAKTAETDAKAAKGLADTAEADAKKAEKEANEAETEALSAEALVTGAVTAPLAQTTTATGAATAPLGKSKLVNNQLGGSNFAKLIGGGTFIDEYNKRSESMIEKLKQLFENPLTNVEIKNSVFIIDSLSDKSDKQFPVFFGKLATMSGLLIKLDTMLNDYNKFYDYLKLNQSLLRHDESASYDIVELWKDIFKAKKTEYYTEKLLKLDIYFYNYLNPTDKTITLEDALRNLVKADETSKITIKIDDVDKVKTNIDSILTNLDNTVISVDHLIFFIENMVLTFIQGTKELDSEPEKKEKEDSIKSLEQRIQQRKDRLLKSAFTNTSAVYSVLYGQSGGGLEIILPTEPLAEIEKDNKNIYLELFRLYSSSILVPSEKSPMTVTNQKQIERTIQLTYMMMSLYDKINLKLGSSDDRSMFAALTEEQKQIKKYSQFNDLITGLIKPQTTIQAVGGGEQQVSEITKPRLDIYRERLIDCRNQLKPYMRNIAILRNLLFETKTGNFPIDETKILIGLYNNVKEKIEEGINSYIKLIPMIFFTIEFPPAVYATQKCKYKFTFDTKKELVEYKFMEGQNRADCNDLGLGPFDEKEFAGISLNSHAAFFESNKLNGTKKLIDDPVIGLGKLIKQDASGTNPINVTINMMFALGASGTGKTTRYFGKSNGHPDDKEGIVPFIINKSLEDAKTADPNAPPTKKISIAYFVCYGQKNTIDSTDAGFNELVIFFNINEINKSNGGATVDENSKYIPYYMPKSTTVISDENTKQFTGFFNNKPKPTIDIPDETDNKYTNFYSSVISKKLERKTYSELKGFITDGESFPTLKPGTEQKTFREIIESTPEIPEIWKEVNPTESSTIGDLFENLIIEQKKINTVLPTKNNIESSRGHTCVLVKIEDIDPNVKTNKVKYFPLFDMAGTENTGQINEFLKEGKNKDKMAKLVQKVNTITQNKDILRDDDETKQYPSLNDLLKYDNIGKWVSTKNKYLTIESVGGGKSRIKVEDFYNQELIQDPSKGPGENFLNKVVKEGYYINHTISMLIFAAMCVGSSLRTELVNSTGKREDKFDDFFPSLFTEIDKFTCIPSATSTADCVGKTMMLLAKKSIGAITNASCIWLQVLFSFLYWNEETPKSINKWLQNITPDTTDALTYLCEPEVQKSEIKIELESKQVVSVMTVEQLYKVGKVSDPNKGLDKLYQLMYNINKSHKFNSTKELTNEVSLVSVNDRNLKIEYQPYGGDKSFISTDFEIVLTNKSYDAQKKKDFDTANEIRQKKLGLTEPNARKQYPVPVDPGRVNLTEKDKKLKAAYTTYNNLDQTTKDAYAKVQFAEFYNDPEKVTATGKIYWDFYEIPTRVKQLEELKIKLKEFEQIFNTYYLVKKGTSQNLNKETVFNNQKKQLEVISEGYGRSKRTVKNTEYDGSFHTTLDDILNKIKDGNFFNLTSTTPSTTLFEPPLVETFKYDNAAEEFGESKEKFTNKELIETFKQINKTNVTFATLKNMLFVLNNIETIRIEKEKDDKAQKATFKSIPNIIEELKNFEKSQQTDLASIKNLLEVTGGKLKLDNKKNLFCLLTKDGALIPIYDVIENINRFPTLPVCPTDPSSLNKLIAENQMHRIRDGRAAATKMTLMHLVTGQGIKHYMVGETMKLCKTLYESTNLDLSV
jgi:hypothetical protein